MASPVVAAWHVTPGLAQRALPGVRASESQAWGEKQGLVFLMHLKAALQLDCGHRSTEPHNFLAVKWFSHFYF